MCYRNRVFPSSYLSLASIGQTEKHFFLKKIINGHFSFVHRFNQLKKLEPMPVFGKRIVGTPPDRFFPYFDTQLIYHLKILP